MFSIILDELDDEMEELLIEEEERLIKDEDRRSDASGVMDPGSAFVFVL